MKILLDPNSRKRLFEHLKKEYSSKSLLDLSIKIKISKYSLDEWRYNYSRYLPENFIPKTLYPNLIILDRKPDNWGKVKGGKETHKILVEKYGEEEIHRRQINGGKKSRRRNEEEIFSLDLSNPSFLELYGALLGDGWLSRLKYKNKNLYIIGISGNRKLDREYFLHLKIIFKNLLGRDVYIKDKPKSNTIEIYFTHKLFLKWLHNELNFPIGLKKDLEIHEKIYSMGFDKMKFVIKGLLDTDGCFYFDKTPVGRPYPCLAISMKAPKLINQIYQVLVTQGFKVQYGKSRSPKEQLILKGSIQLKKWMQTIGSSNKRNLDKIARVTQLDRVPSS